MNQLPYTLNVRCCKRTGWADKEIIVMVVDWLQEHVVESQDWMAYIHDNSDITDSPEQRILKTVLKVGFRHAEHAVQFKLTFSELIA